MNPTWVRNYALYILNKVLGQSVIPNLALVTKLKNIVIRLVIFFINVTITIIIIIINVFIVIVIGVVFIITSIRKEIFTCICILKTDTLKQQLDDKDKTIKEQITRNTHDAGSYSFQPSSWCNRP